MEWFEIVSGWNYAKITDVVVHRVHEGKALTSPKDTAQLVNNIEMRTLNQQVFYIEI